LEDLSSKVVHKDRVLKRPEIRIHPCEDGFAEYIGMYGKNIIKSMH
jgi:hypothetical protein